MNKRFTGISGEYLAAEFLKKQGYKILERNADYAGVEIDIIARKDKKRFFAKSETVLVFCEVKASESSFLDSPAEAVTQRQTARYVKAAKVYAAAHGLFDTDVRFDVIAVKDGAVEHIENAFYK